MCEWEVREREMDLYPQPITDHPQDLLMVIGLMNFYQEDMSLKGNSTLLAQMIHHWDHRGHAFHIGPSQCFQPNEEAISFITRISM